MTDERVAELERRVDVLESRLDGAVNLIERLEDRLDGDGAQVDMAAREAMIDTHVVLQDLKHGREGHPKAQQRAARLLQPFIRELDPEHQLTGIEASHGRLKLSGEHARRLLAEHGLATNSGMSVTVGRAMDAAVRGSEWGDDETPLFRHASESGHTLSVAQDEWEAYLSTVADALDADVAVTSRGADDPGGSGEDVDDVAAQLDALDAANSQSANTVVSGSDESVLGGETTD